MTADIDQQVHHWNRVLIGIAAICVVIGAGFAINIPASLSARHSADLTLQSQQISGCRSKASAAVGTISSALADANSRLGLLTNIGLDAAARQDSAGLLAAETASRPVRVEIAADGVKLVAASKSYATAVDLSVKDPARFLRECRG